MGQLRVGANTLAVPEEPLRTFSASFELGSLFCRYVAKTAQGHQQLLEAHADVKPNQDPFGRGR